MRGLAAACAIAMVVLAALPPPCTACTTAAAERTCSAPAAGARPAGAPCCAPARGLRRGGAASGRGHCAPAGERPALLAASGELKTVRAAPEAAPLLTAISAGRRNAAHGAAAAPQPSPPSAVRARSARALSTLLSVLLI